MSAEQPSSNPEITYLRGRVRMIEEDNAFVNNENDQLREANDTMVTDIGELREQLDVAERRVQFLEAELARVTAFWRAAEEELTSKIAENEKLSQRLEGDASTNANDNNAPS
jgi:chromosome segregation ATPase